MSIWHHGVRRGVATLGAITLLAATASCGEAEPAFLGSDQIHIAYKGDQPGTSYKGEGSTDFTGFEVHLGNHIARELNITERAPAEIASGDRVEWLKSERADLVIATFSVTDERMDDVHFAGVYAMTYQGLLVRNSVPRNQVRRICTLTDTNSEETLDNTEDQYMRKMELARVNTLGECVQRLQSGEVQGISTDTLILHGLASYYEDEGFEVDQNVQLGAPQYYGVGIRKGHPEDCQRLQGIVEDYVKSSDWSGDFRQSFPGIPEGEIDSFRPSETQSKNRSCRDTASP